MERRSPLILASSVLAVVAVSGTARAQLDSDPRAARPAPPTTIEALAERFLPAYAPHGIDGEVTLGEGEVRTFTQAVEPGVCYAAAAVGESGVDVDIRVLRNDDIVVQDVSLDSYPVVEWCAERAESLTIAITAFDGATSVEYGLFASPDARRAAAGPHDELSNRLASHIASAAPRWRWSGAQWRATFASEGVQEMPTAVPEGGCLAIAVVGQSGVDDVDVSLVDPNGAEVSRDYALDARALVVHCGDAGDPLTARIAVRSGSGVVAAQLLAHAASERAR
jgi:hypothetical protein